MSLLNVQSGHVRQMWGGQNTEHSCEADPRILCWVTPKETSHWTMSHSLRWRCPSSRQQPGPQKSRCWIAPPLPPQNLEGLCAKSIKPAIWQESPFYTASRCFEVWNLYPLSFFQSAHHSFFLLLSDNAGVFRRFLFPRSPKNLTTETGLWESDVKQLAQSVFIDQRLVFLLTVGWSATSGGCCGYHGSKWGGRVSIESDEEMRTGGWMGQQIQHFYPVGCSSCPVWNHKSTQSPR